MGAKPRAYLVDDDPAVVEALASLVSMLGFQVDSFASAEEFLEAYRPSGPECLILDVRLPGMSGLDLQRELGRRGSSLQIVFVTGHADATVAAEATRLGAVGFLEKPFQAQDLVDSIQKAMAGVQNGP